MGAVKDGVRMRDECEAVLVRDPPKPRFVIFYADGSTVVDDGKDLEVVWRVPRAWINAPPDGVQFVIKHRPDGKLTVLTGGEQYPVMRNGEPMMTADVTTQLRALGICKSGFWIPDEEYEAIREKVRAYRAEHTKKK